MIQARFVAIREATEAVLRRLEHLSTSVGTEPLCASLQACMQETEMWSASSPTGHDLTVLMTRIHALQEQVGELERRPSAE